MDAAHRKKKSGRGNKSKDVRKAGSATAATSSSFADEKESSGMNSKKEDSVQNQQSKQPGCPIKKPPTPYKIFVKDNKDRIVRNNPRMNSKEISSLIGKMFKALSKKKKEKYIKLAKVAREEYKKQVQEFKEENPILKLVAPLAPTPFSIYCRERRQSIYQGKNKFSLLSEKDKLKWINRALAEEANYIDQFEIFEAKNPHLKPKMTPVLNEEEKLLVYMRCLFDSEYPSVPAKKDGTPTEMTQWNVSWNALSKKEKKVHQERVIAMKHEFNVKLSAYLSKLPFEKGEQETRNCLPDSKGTKRKKRAIADSSAPFKKSKTSIREEKDSDSSEEQGSSTLPDVSCKKKAAKVKRSAKKSSTIVVDSSADSGNCDDISLLKKKKLTIESKSTESCEESSDESESKPEQSNPPKKTVAILGASVSSASSKNTKFGIKNSSPQLATNGSDPSSTSSSDDESQEMKRSSSSSSKSGKSIAPARIAIQIEEDSSDEDQSDSSEEESKGPNKKSSGEETDESSASSKQSKTSSSNQNDSSEKEELSTLPIAGNSSFDSDNSGDVTLSKTKQISSTSAEKSSEDSSKESGFKEELSIIITNSSFSSSVRPLWALKQRLFKNEPPMPPKTAAEWRAFEIHQVQNIPDEKKKELWNGLSEKKRKMLKIEHTKRLEEYEEKLQAF